jgi:hypothetical protein
MDRTTLSQSRGSRSQPTWRSSRVPYKAAMLAGVAISAHRPVGATDQTVNAPR